ncbi:RBBP8 N-terminal-like protein isoform X6 [Orcinus orca]|uniref:RBBP8 N-terminal-like protein isoform X6 n=1 Tax=Orcinus orca TaxID=9733 RepID=UPI002111D7E6|nr:RBBP8 N-terminal-like protein isoform X6 [Orcinus orca]
MPGRPEGGGALCQEPSAQGAAEGAEGEPAGAGEQAAGRPVRPLHGHPGAGQEEAAGVRELPAPEPAACLPTHDRADPAAGGKRCLEGGGEAAAGPRTGPSPSSGRVPQDPCHPCCSPPWAPGRPSLRSHWKAMRRWRTATQSPQHISNQLHGTIAVVRPGSRACSANRGSVNGTSPLPPPRSSPPSPSGEHSLPLDRLLLAHSFLQASLPSAKPCESPKSSLQADHLCHLNRHLALPRGSPHSGPQPPGLKAGEAEAWEEPVGLLGLPGTLAGVRDPRLEGALHLLLAQQLWARGRAGGAGLRGPPVPGKAPPSPPAGPHSEGPGGGAAWAALPRGQHPRPAGPGSPGAKEASATQDCVPDKPLDLSEWGRGRDGAPKPASPPGSLSPPGAHTPSPKPPQGGEPSVQSGVQGLGDCTKGAEEAEAEEPPPSTEPSHSLPGPSLPSPSGPGHEDRGRPKLPPCPQRPDGDGHPGEELSKAQGQQLESDELDKPDTSDSEVGLSTEAGATQSLPAEGPRGFCATEHGRGPQKRKRASDQWSKGLRRRLGCGRHNAPLLPGR